jgi:NAD(P)-dependent dehydrogenase (short-subunit alcohol dehydrogenase family)
LKKKVIIVTGANSGIGLETARVLALRGAHVFVLARSEQKGEEAASEIKKSVPNANLTVMKIDLSSSRSIRSFVEEFKKLNLPLHVLINNAGCMALPERSETEDGLEFQMGTNHIGHFYLTSLLTDKLIESQPSRVVCLASSAHRMADLSFLSSEKLESTKYGPWSAYGNSKFANMLHAKGFNEHYSTKGVIAYSVHPGGIWTNLQSHVTIGMRLLMILITPFFKTIPQGAATTVYCAVTPGIEKHGGSFFEDCNASKPYTPALQDAFENKSQDFWNTSEKIISKFK